MKKKLLYILLIVISIITIVHLIFPPQVYQNSSNGDPRTAIQINKNDVIEEYFVTNLKDIDRLGIRFSTYQHKNNHGKISISLYGNNHIIKTKRIDLSTIQDNQMVYLNFDKQSNSNKTKYKIILKYDEYYDDIQLATWLGLTGTDNNYVLMNGDRKVYSLYYTISGKGKVNDFLLYDLLLLSILIIVYSCYGGKNEKYSKK